MILEDEPQAIDKLLDEEKLDFLSVITDREYKLFTKLAIRAKVLDDEIAKEVVKRKLAMAVSRQGKRSEQLIQFARSIQQDETLPAEEVDAFQDSGNILQKTRQKIEKSE